MALVHFILIFIQNIICLKQRVRVATYRAGDGSVISQDHAVLSFGGVAQCGGTQE